MNAKPRKLKRVVVREELVAVTKDYTAAIILNQFLYWSKRVFDYDEMLEEEKARIVASGKPEPEIKPMQGWIYKKAAELIDECMFNLSEETVLRRIDELLRSGFLLRRNNPNIKWDRTYQYRVDFAKLIDAIGALGYSLADWTFGSSASDSHDDDCNPQNESVKHQNEAIKHQIEAAIPKITTEKTTETKENNSNPLFESQTEPVNLAEAEAIVASHYGSSANNYRKAVRSALRMLVVKETMTADELIKHIEGRNLFDLIGKRSMPISRVATRQPGEGESRARNGSVPAHESDPHHDAIKKFVLTKLVPADIKAHGEQTIFWNPREHIPVLRVAWESGWDEDEIIRRLARYWKSGDDFYRDAGYPLALFVRNFNSFAKQRRRNGNENAKQKRTRSFSQYDPEYQRRAVQTLRRQGIIP